MRPGPGTSTRRCCPSRAGARPRAPGHPGHPRQPRPLDRGGGGRGRGAGPVRRAAARLERVLGPEHPDTLAARDNLALWTGEAGDAAGARDQYAALLPVLERVLGAEHPDTLTARANLARWTGEAGDAAGARDQYAALLPVLERVSGPEHPDTLAARAQPRSLDRGRRGMRPGPATSTPRCCPSASGSSALSTRTP